MNSFETWSVVTHDGRVLQGVIQRADARVLVLRDAQQRELAISRQDIEEIARLPTSIMPQGLEANLNAQQLGDLLAYLESLRD